MASLPTETHVPEWPAYMWTEWTEGMRPVFKDDAKDYTDDEIIGYEPYRFKRLLTQCGGKYWSDMVVLTFSDVQDRHPKELEAIIKTQEEVALLSMRNALGGYD